MGASENVRHLRAERARAWSEGKALLDESRGNMSAEQRLTWERINAHMNELDAQIERNLETVQRENESAVLRELHLSPIDGAYRRASGGMTESDRIRAFSQRGGPSEFEVNIAPAIRERELIRQGADARELRALYSDTGSVGSAVPTSTARSLYEYMEGAAPMMRMPTTKIITTSGEDMRFPRLTSTGHTAGTQVISQGTTIGGTDPAFTYMTLGAFKYGSLVQVSNEVLADASVDLSSFLMKDMGRAVGRLIDADFVVGTGSGEPLGVMNAITGSGTIVTGGSLVAPTVDRLIDLQFSVNDSYRSDPSCLWLLNDSTAGTIRKMRDGGGGTVGALLWEPSQVSGMLERTPDRLFGHPVWTDVNVASLASASKSIAFGMFAAAYVRMAGPIVIERDDSLGFATDTVYFRARVRCDSDVIDTAAINILTQRVA